jgi:hypothetical protein
MKRLAQILAAAFVASACAGAPESWLQSPPKSLGLSHDWTEVPRSAVLEVSVSKFASAEADLVNVASAALAPSAAEYFSRPGFKCAPADKPFLIRAFYMNGGTGAFTLYWAGTALVVAHDSLGPKRTLQRTALVACLARQPSQVFSSVGSDL